MFQDLFLGGQSITEQEETVFLADKIDCQPRFFSIGWSRHLHSVPSLVCLSVPEHIREFFHGI